MLRTKQDQYVPLKRVNVEAKIRSFAADVTITQVFRNDETTPIEAVYCFPIEEQAAVYAFRARIDDREIIAQLKETKQAQDEYNDALQRGHGAYLLEQDEKSRDNFIISVGALPPGQECHITISYVSELDLVENGTKIRFVVPTTIAPRYDPTIGSLNSPAGTTAKYVQSTPYTIKFRCWVENVGIARVSSISHPIRIDLIQQGAYIIEFAQQDTHLDRDILVDIELEKNRSSTILAVEPGAIMASFILTEQDWQRARENVVITNEFIFVVDCSGSMRSENKIGYARQAVLLFLKSLPAGCKFNIVRFGSNHERLFDDITIVYNETNAEKAKTFTEGMQADLGGTELLAPLQWLEENPPAQGHSRQIFLLTDGEISNVDQVIDLCRSMSTSTRIFSFGLGHSSSRSLVKGLARASNGRFVFIPPNTSVDVYVHEQLQKALQPCITDVKINWHLGATVMTVPMNIPPVYINDRLILYALTEGKSISFDDQARVELYVEHHRLGEAKVYGVQNVSNDETITRLAAKALILELQHSKVPSSFKKNMLGSKQTRLQERSEEEMIGLDDDDKEMKKKRIIELSLKHNILSPHTAFIGIERRTNGNNVDMVLREVPIQISADDQHLFSSSSYGSQLATSVDGLKEYQRKCKKQLKQTNKMLAQLEGNKLNSSEAIEKYNNKSKKELINLAKEAKPMQMVGNNNVALIGLTGTGKSTMLNSLLGLNGDKQADTGCGATTRVIKPYQGTNCVLWDVPGGDELSYMTMEYVSFFKGLTRLLILIQCTVRENSGLMKLMDEIGLNYDIVVNKMDCIEEEHRKEFCEHITKEVLEIGLEGVGKVFFVSAKFPREFPDWIRMLHYLTNSSK